MSELKVISKFAGEAFGTDNIRTVYAGEAQDTERRPDRTIILVGPIGAGKSSFIDFLCNYFYDVKIDSDFRYKIADEIFDSTTPKKAVTKYVFNATKQTYRPIIIDTPGIGDPHGLKADRELATLVSDYLSAASKERFHAVCLMLPQYMHTINQQIDDDLHLTLSLFPDWMRRNIVPIITYSDFGEYDTKLLKHFGLDDNNRFFLNNEYLFKRISTDPHRQSNERQVWSRNERNIIEFLRYIGSLRPQTISRRLPSESEPGLNQEFEEERRVRSSRETITYLLETDEVKQIREEFTEKSTSPKRLADSSHRAVTSTVFQIPVNKPQSSPIGSQRVETRTVLGENRSNIPVGQGATFKPIDMNKKETFIENIEETIENLELLRRYIYDPSSRTYRIEYAHEVKVHESRRSSQGGSYSDLRRISPTRGGDASREILDINRGIKRNSSAPNLEKDGGKENRLDYSPSTLKRLLGDAIWNGSARIPQTNISPVRPQVVRMPFDPNEFERQSRQQRPGSRNQPIGQATTFEPAPVSQGSPDRSLDKSKDGIFERNSSSRQSLHNSPIRHGGVRHAIVTKDPNAVGQEIAQPAQRPVVQPVSHNQIGQPIRQPQPIPGPDPRGYVNNQVQGQDPRYAVPQRPIVITQERREQGSGFLVGQKGREIEDTTVTRQYGPPGGPGGNPPGTGQGGQPQGGSGSSIGQPIGRGTPGSRIGQPIGQQGGYDPNRQGRNQPYPYDSTGQTAGYPFRPGTGQGSVPPGGGQGVDPRYQQGLTNAPQQSYDPNRQTGPSPYIKTDVHGVRTDYIGRRDGKWIEKRGYEITREDLGAPKDVDPSLNDQQRLLTPEDARRRRKLKKKRSPLFNCCFYVVAPLVVIAVVTTVVITIVLLA